MEPTQIAVPYSRSAVLGAGSLGDGVLVLSEFAGAAVELHSAVITNPFSHRSMDTAVLEALAMPEEERRTRMAQLLDSVARFDISAWANQHQDQFDGLIAATPN